jgi:hypothetical protein
VQRHAPDAAYWLLMHPVNTFWLKEIKLKENGASFFLTQSCPVEPANHQIR